MRHRKNVKRLSRQSAHRKAVLRNLVKSLIEKEKIRTTLLLAKESRRLAEKLITLGKKNTVAGRRQAYSVLGNRDLVKLLFSEIAPRFASRAGGYTRIVKLGNRKGDNAKLAVLELTELVEKEKKAPKKKKEKKTAVKKETKSAAEDKEKKKEAKTAKQEMTEQEKGFLGGLKKFLKKDKTE